MGSVWIRWFCDSILGFCDSKLGFCDSKLGFLTRNSVFVTRNSVFFLTRNSVFVTRNSILDKKKSSPPAKASSGFVWRPQHSDLRLESIRIDSVSQKIGSSDSTVLVVGVCLPNHRSTITAAYTTVTITTHVSWHESASSVRALGSGVPIFCEGARLTRTPARPPLPPTSWVTAMCGRIESDESIFWRESNWIEIILAIRNALVTTFSAV